MFEKIIEYAQREGLTVERHPEEERYFLELGKYYVVVYWHQEDREYRILNRFGSPLIMHAKTQEKAIEKLQGVIASFKRRLPYTGAQAERGGPQN